MRFRIIHLLLLMTAFAVVLTIGVLLSRVHLITRVVILFLLALYTSMAWVLFFVSKHGRR
jgi:hypothetical protein